MLRTAISIASTLIIAASLWFYGCGTSDLLDEVGGRYATSVSFTDADEETLDIDVARDECDDNVSLAYVWDDAEPYTNTFATITIEVDENTPGITISSYTIEYFGELSEDGTHAQVMPPDLNDLQDQGTNNIFIASGESAEFDITCFSMDQKQEYRTLIGWAFDYADVDENNDGTTDYYFPYWYIAAGSIYENLDISRYTFRITLHCTDEYGVERDIVVQRTVYLGSYDNC